MQSGTEHWIGFHGTTNPAGSCWTDRNTYAQRVDWNEDGTTSFGEPISTSEDIPSPSGEPSL
jgi:GH43 family beta-xylosidase